MKKYVKGLVRFLPAIFTVAVLCLNYRNISISVGSIGPVFVMGIMLLMFFIYNSNDASATGFYVVSSLSDKREEEQLKHMHRFARILLSMLPLQLIFVLFFSNVFVKSIGGIAIVFSSFIINNIIDIIWPIQ